MSKRTKPLLDQLYPNSNFFLFSAVPRVVYPSGSLHAQVGREAIAVVFRNSSGFPTPVSAAVNNETDTSDGKSYISLSTGEP